MSFIGRGSLPQNYIDSVNDGLRLPQPTPQFFFAMMALGALQRTAAIEMGMGGAEQMGRLMTEGGGAAVPQDFDRFLRTADAYPGAVMAINAFGKNEGDTVKMRRPLYDGGGYDEASREVRPNKTTSLTGISIKAEEVPVILKQYEGPFASGGTVVQPYQIEKFDAKYRHNKDNLAQLTAQHLSFDYTKWLDAVIRDKFRATSFITYADDVSNVLSMTASAGHSINLQAILKARQAISDRERAPFSNGRYMCVMPTVFNTDMASDPSYVNLAKLNESKNLLFRYLGSVQDVDIFESTTLKTYAAGETVPGDGNAVPSGSSVYEGLLFGPEAVGFGEAEPPTMYTTSDTDFDKNVKVIWRSCQAFQTLDNRGIQRILFQDA